MKKYLWIFSLLVIFASCSSLPLVESNYREKGNETGRYLYDLESNLAYKVEHDDENIYLQIKTDDQTSIQKMIRHGLYVYIDPRGGKSKDTYVLYPLPVQPGRGEMKRPGMMTSEGDREFDVNVLLENLSMEAIYTHEGNSEKMPVYLRDNDIKIDIHGKGKRELVYDLQFPLDRIVPGSQDDKSELSIGILTGKVEMSSMGSRPAGGGMQGGGKPGGGRSGGMSGGGRPGGENSSGIDRESMMEQISLWFKIDLGPKTEE